MMVRKQRIRSTGKSIITNGTKLLHGINKNSKWGRRYRDLYLEYMEQSGGQAEQLCKQIASLIVLRERMDADVLNGKPIDQFHFIRVANALTRTLKALKAFSIPPTDEAAARKRRAREEALLT